jgi:hypothetical protein
MNAKQRRVRRRKTKRDFITALRDTKSQVAKGRLSFLQAVGKLRFGNT